MQEDVEEVLGRLLLTSRAPNTIRTYENAISEFRSWQRQGPQSRMRNDLDSAAIFLAKKSQYVSHRSLATFVAALAYHRMGRKSEEDTQWKILDEMVKSSKRREIVRAQKFATTDEWLQLLRVATQMRWQEWRKSKKDQEQRGAAIFLAKEDWLDSAIRKCLEKNRDDPILATRNGSQWSANAAASEIKKMCDAAGLRRLSPHSFRRGGTMRALDEGIDPVAVQRRGRWASTRSMRPYVNHSLHTQGGPAHITQP
ncbi:site-specific recombinase, phage integrase family [Ancylostoma ceylanicum]|uniref:Site-specific recombinase, phage integrase family n=1 Tax=Ancylostoma ceylanicum TaxID=53326 RepID=A0A0D6L656_9BILA|nr:site-specific recombinase, phage integrase family [Ancylostoma ceylanicum]